MEWNSAGQSPSRRVLFGTSMIGIVHFLALTETINHVKNYIHRYVFEIHWCCRKVREVKFKTQKIGVHFFSINMC